MVNITYTGSKFTRRRLPNGRWITFRPNETVEIKSDRLAKELETQRDFVIAEGNTPKVGAGIKTHVKPPKSRGRPPKSKAKTKVKKEVAKPKKGLKKAKKGKAD